MSGEKECSICYEEVGEKNNCVTDCGHQFCFKCIVTALQHNNTCPCCRATLVTVKNENEDESEEDESEDDDDESEEVVVENDAEVEDIVVRLQEKGVTMLDVVSLLIGRYSKTRETDIEIEERIETLHNRVWDVIVEADDETLEQNRMHNEDISILAIELSRPRQCNQIANLIHNAIRNAQIKMIH